MLSYTISMLYMHGLTRKDSESDSCRLLSLVPGQTSTIHAIIIVALDYSLLTS